MKDRLLRQNTFLTKKKNLQKNSSCNPYCSLLFLQKSLEYIWRNSLILLNCNTEALERSLSVINLKIHQINGFLNQANYSVFIYWLIFETTLYFRFKIQNPNGLLSSLKLYLEHILNNRKKQNKTKTRKKQKNPLSDKLATFALLQYIYNEGIRVKSSNK